MLRGTYCLHHQGRSVLSEKPGLFLGKLQGSWLLRIAVGESRSLTQGEQELRPRGWNALGPTSIFKI
jgi:hypothetical protein